MRGARVRLRELHAQMLSGVQVRQRLRPGTRRLCGLFLDFKCSSVPDEGKQRRSSDGQDGGLRCYAMWGRVNYSNEQCKDDSDCPEVCGKCHVQTGPLRKTYSECKPTECGRPCGKDDDCMFAGDCTRCVDYHCSKGTGPLGKEFGKRTKKVDDESESESGDRRAKHPVDVGRDSAKREDKKEDPVPQNEDDSTATKKTAVESSSNERALGLVSVAVGLVSMALV